MTSNQPRNPIGKHPVPQRDENLHDLRERSRAGSRPSGAAAANADSVAQSADLSDLKSEIQRLSALVADISNKRARHAASIVDDGLNGVRGAVRQHPWISIGIAGALGAIVVIATTSRSVERRRIDRLRRSARRMIDGFDTHTVIPHAQDLRRFLPDVANARSSISERAERLSNAIADIDPKNAIGPIFEAARSISQAINRTKN